MESNNRNMKSVKVHVTKGMFSSEVVATLHTIDGDFDFFVEKDKLERRKDDWLLRVHLLGCDDTRKIETIALPLHVEMAQKRVFNIEKQAA